MGIICFCGEKLNVYSALFNVGKVFPGRIGERNDTVKSIVVCYVKTVYVRKNTFVIIKREVISPPGR